MKVKDPISGYTHLAGMVLSIIALVVLVCIASWERNIWKVVAFSVYGASMILLYGASSLYHLLSLGEKSTLVLRKIDHAMIYILIAGTYTPITLLDLRAFSYGWGWSIFGVIWGLAIIGVVINSVWFKAPRWVSTGIYLAMGWMVLVAIFPIVKAINTIALSWLGAGGIAYTIGAVIYGIKKPNISKEFGFHELFHIFVMLGSACHFVMMLYLMQV